jgi:hypothetical protein
MKTTARSPKSRMAARGVLARARARRRNRGAVMFIVVVTLGLLAAMGVYGLTATSADIKSAGHMREALQAQKAGEHSLMMTAETFNPSTAKALVEAMSGPKRTTDGKTAVTTPPLSTYPVPPSYACLRLSMDEMKIAANSVNQWTAVTPFASDSFGAITNTPFVQVEISNPVDIPPPPGSGYDPATQRFTQVTATVFVQVKSAAGAPAESVVAGRGRMTVGPITGSAANY